MNPPPPDHHHRTAPRLPPGPVVVIDSREQAPLVFPPSILTVVAGLPTGDYSVQGFEDRVALERKSVVDLLACVGRERDRFERELERLAALDYGALVIEATLAEVLAGYDLSLVSGRTAVGSVLAWSVDHRLPVFFCGDRHLTSATVLKLLTKWWEHRTDAGAMRPPRTHGRLLRLWQRVGGSGDPPATNKACREAIAALVLSVAKPEVNDAEAAH